MSDSFIGSSFAALSSIWFMVISGISPAMDFTGGVDNLVASLRNGLPRPICVSIYWSLCIAGSLGILSTLISVVPSLGNKTLLKTGTLLMAIVVVLIATLNSIASGLIFSTLSHCTVFVIAMKVVAQTVPCNDGESKFLDWLITTRPWSFPASLLPLIVTAASLVWYEIEIQSAQRASELILSMVIMQALANQVNSLADWRNGVDKADFANSDMTVLNGHLSIRAIVLSSLALLIAFLTLSAHYIRGIDAVFYNTDKWVIVTGAILAITYTAAPIPLKYIGLGNAVVFLCFGPLSVTHFVLCLTDSAQSSSRIPDLLLFTLPVAMMVTVILSANNIRDMNCDWKAGCYTLEGMLGKKGSRIYFGGLVIGAHLLSVWIAMHYRCYGFLLTLAALPRSLWLINLVCFTPETKENFKFVDQASAHSLLIFGLSTALGIASATQDAQASIPGLLFSFVLLGFLYVVG